MFLELGGGWRFLTTGGPRPPLLRPVSLAGTERGRHRLGLSLSRASPGVLDTGSLQSSKSLSVCRAPRPLPRRARHGGQPPRAPSQCCQLMGQRHLLWSFHTRSLGWPTGPFGWPNGLIWYRLGCRPLPSSSSIHSSLGRRSLSRSMRVSWQAAQTWKSPRGPRPSSSPLPPLTPEWP